VTNEITRFSRKADVLCRLSLSLETCFVGGNVAENAGGASRQYGVTARYVMGLEWSRPGEIVRLGGKLVKDVTGYNMIGLMVEARGRWGSSPNHPEAAAAA